MIWVTVYVLRPSLLAISSGRRPCSLYSSASRSWDLVHGLGAGRAGATRRGIGLFWAGLFWAGLLCAGWGRAGLGTTAPAVPASDVETEVPNEPRRWSANLPRASSSLVCSSRSRYCSADLLTPTATMVRPLRFFSWHSGFMQ